MRERIALWMGKVRDALRVEDGQTAVEYGVLLALILAISVLVITAIGVDVKGAFNAIEDAVNGSQAS
jgi:Flp pilus assembly pilin Flp